MRPATPGFIVTLLATILLAIVSFSVPWFKFVYFLKASLSAGGNNGTITFGVLGYCVQLSNGTTCSKPSIGYELGKTSSASFTYLPINRRLVHRYQQAGGRQNLNPDSSSCRQVDHLCALPACRCPYPGLHLLCFRPPCPC